MVSRAAFLLVVATLPPLLASCGGGIYLGYDDRDLDDRPPSVSLAASPNSARAGATVTLVAAASDDRGIDSVAFYRLDASGNAVLLGSDGVAPYTWETTLPSNGQSSVSYLARATDSRGQRTDSAAVSVAVLP